MDSIQQIILSNNNSTSFTNSINSNGFNFPPIKISDNPWCLNDSDNDYWDGIDFSDCFKKRELNGYIPLAFLSLSFLSLFIILIYTLCTRRSKSTSSLPLSPLATRRLSNSSSHSRERRTRSLSVSSVEIKLSGPRAISEAENEVILSVVQDESPDLELKTLLEMGVGNGASVSKSNRGGRNSNGNHLRIGSTIEEEGEDEEDNSEKKKLTIGMLFRAFFGCKKDVVNVLGSILVLGGLILRLLESHSEPGGYWVAILAGAWGWTLILTISKLAISYFSKLRRIANPSAPHRLSPWYTMLEIHIIPWYFIFAFPAFFDARSALLNFIINQHNEYRIETFARDSSIFLISFGLLVMEFLAPRPSKFSSRSSRDKSLPDELLPGELPRTPETNASLYSIATFSYASPFMYTSAFPSATSAPVSMATIPDLRPDDKTARVLLTFRTDVARINEGRSEKKKWKITAQLFWHFRWELAGQQLWSYLRVSVVALPPLFLKGLLSHISKRNRGEYAPMHVALLYAGAMFIFQIISSLAASQALWIGRRICIRLRSIIVGEIFTKALRRKDMAGSSNTKEEDEKKEGDVKAGEGEKKEGITDEELEKASSGKIINLISVDTFRLSEICAYLHFLWPELFLTIVVTIYLLFQVLGLSAAAGVVSLVLITPLQTFASKLFIVYQKKVLEAADARLSLATEVISSVRIVKYFAWETKFLDKMNETRQKELKAIWARALAIVAGNILMFGCPVVVSVATFVFHTKYLHRDLSAETAFTALALFNILRGPLEGVTDMIVNVLQAHVSLMRINDFLEEQETTKYATIQKPTSLADPIIGFVDGEFTWSDEKLAREDSTVFRIKGLNLNFPVGKLSIILGPVGSGKTTLLLSLLGETNKLSGASYLPSAVVRSSGLDPKILTDTTAYCSQSPWLLSETIRENILFGSIYNEQRYKDVVEACALGMDLKQFELGDATEVGEKGTVLSGGQKARISLARAIYSPAKHVLLDDVLSAVDSHTGEALYKCLNGRLMRHRTVILVTHAVDLCLPGAAFVVSMDNGKIVASGSPDQYAFGNSSEASNGKGGGLDSKVDPFASAFTIEEIAAAGDDDTNQEVLEAHVVEENRARAEKLILVHEETQSEGAVKATVYLMYIKAMGGYSIFFFALLIFAAAQLSEIAVSLALRYWAASYDETSSEGSLAAASVHVSNHHWTAAHSSASSFFSARPTSIFDTHRSSDEWLKIYLILAGINLVLYGLRMGFFLYRGVIASRVIYTKLIARILGARIRFFDSTPSGRILNRLSKDTEQIDQDVSVAGAFLLIELLGVIGIIGTISAVLPVFLFAAVIITLVYIAIGYVYLASSRELKRFESVTKSPIIGLFGETLHGVATIRAYGDSARFTKQAFTLLNDNNRPFFSLWRGNRWLSVRVDVAGSLVTLAAAIFVLLQFDMNAALAGFILSFAISFNDRILWVVRCWSMMEINANSIERVGEYMELENEKEGGIIPPASWPSRDGSIEVEGLTASYSSDLPAVLKNVTFKVLPREKIGICGRTGSGKSTLGLSFFRFIEPTSGRIVIDGLDINTLSLPELRSRLTIVAQESALFAGSLRFNLDPFEAYDDLDIWDALRRVQMAAPTGATPRATPGPSRAASIRNGETSEAASESTVTPEEAEERFVVKSLDMVVSEGGKNFSQGQRQLLALARGILKLQTSSILLLDESTASLDHATDERIQRTIRDEMQEATILCIAHRLRTIIDYDKILVLGNGEVLEFDTPANLLATEGSAFLDLCRKSGEYEELLEIATASKLK